jgi:ubiquinone/menaquinone biosynthesis C-methylase UbiE
MQDAFGFLNQIKAKHVLDAATGRGEFINILKQNLGSFVQIIGVDSSERSVDYAQKAFPDNDVEIYKMDLAELSFEDDYFDLVSISNSLHHLASPNKVFSELMRVLKPGGILVVSEMYKDGDQSEAQITHIRMHHWLATIDSRFGIYHRETFTKDEIIAMLNKLKLDKMITSDFHIPVDNPKEARNCDSLKHNIEDTFKRLETIVDGETLITEGKAVLERINSVGCAFPNRLLIYGLKPKNKKSQLSKEK